MKKSCFFLVLIVLASCAPTLSVKEGSRFETLYMFVEVNPAIHPRVQTALQSATDDFMEKHNRGRHAFRVARTDNVQESTLVVRILRTELVSPSDQAVGALVSVVGLVGVPLAMIAADAGFVIAFFYFPQASSTLEVYLTDDIAEGPAETEILNSPAFLKHPENQVVKHGQRFENYLTRLVSQIEQSYTRQLKK